MNIWIIASLGAGAAYILYVLWLYAVDEQEYIASEEQVKKDNDRLASEWGKHLLESAEFREKQMHIERSEYYLKIIEDNRTQIEKLERCIGQLLERVDRLEKK